MWQSRDNQWRNVTSDGQKSPVSHLTRSHPEVAAGARKPAFWARLCSYRLYPAGIGSQVKGNDIKWPQATGTDPEVTSFEQKSPGSGCERPKTWVLGSCILLQSCNSLNVAVTWGKDVVTSVGRKWPGSDIILLEVTFCRKSAGSGYTMRKTCVLCAFMLLQAVTRRMWPSQGGKRCHDFRWPEVTHKWRLIGSYLEVTVGGWKLLLWAHLRSYRAVTCTMWQSGHRKSRHVTLGDRKWPKVTLFDHKSPKSGCRMLKTRILCTFMVLQGCNSQELAVRQQEMMSHDLRCPEVTWKRH